MPLTISSRNNYSINSPDQVAFKDDNILAKISIGTQGVFDANDLKVCQLSIPSQGFTVTSGFFALSFGENKMLTGQIEKDQNVTEFQTVVQVRQTTANNFPTTNYLNLPIDTHILVCIRFNLTENIDVAPTVIGVVGMTNMDPDITNNVDFNEIYYLPIARIVKDTDVILDPNIVQNGTTNDASAQVIYPLTNIKGANASGATKPAVQLTSQNGVVDWDLEQGDFFHLTLTESTRLNNPINIPNLVSEKRVITLEVIQDSVGGHDFVEFGETIVPTQGLNIILHQNENTIRYTVDDGDLSNVQVGQQVIITGCAIPSNNGIFLITDTDNTTFFDVSNLNRSDATDNELNSPGTYRIVKSVFVPQTSGFTNINLSSIQPNQKNYIQFVARGDGKLDVFSEKLSGFETVDSNNNQIILNT